jgi:pimeloyl-ACP methyl ester carboxylesterase
MTSWFEGSGGLRLAADAHGDAAAPPALLLHGGGQTRQAWGATTRTIAGRGWRAIALDLRGHGESDWSEDGDYRLDTFAADLRAVIAALDQPPVIVGASLGGMTALRALTEQPPAPAAALVLVDVAHRFDPAGAQRVVDFMMENPDGFTHPREASAAVARYLPHRPPPTDPDGISKNLRLRDGRWHWHWDPRLLDGPSSLTSSRDRGEAAGRRYVAVERLTVPTLLVRGAMSDVVSSDMAREFAELVPHAEVLEVERAAHMVAGDRNDRFGEAVVAFLETLPVARRA